MLIYTITGVVSGNASISRYCNDQAPAAMITSTAISTRPLFRNEKSMIQLSMLIWCERYSAVERLKSLKRAVLHFGHLRPTGRVTVRIVTQHPGCS